MTRLSKLTAAAVLLSGLTAAGITIAQDTPPLPAAPDSGAADGPPPDRPEPWMMMRGPGPMIDFAAIDTDGNGILSREELTARATARLGTADTNGDKILQRDELIAALPGPRDGLMMVFAPDPAALRADRLLAFMGATEAGQIEIAALADRQVNGILAMVDTNHDGSISKAEADAMPSHGPQKRDGRHGHGDNDGPGRRPHY